MTSPKLRLYGLVAAASLLLSNSAFVQDATRISAGEAAWDKAGCLQCHGAAGEGGSGGEFVAGPSLQRTLLSRAMLAETIACGRPGTEMPGWLEGAYTESPCYGLPKGPPPPGTVLTPVLSAEEILALTDFLQAKIVRK